ncbi:MAG: ABC transporter substrate-binding protein [Rhizobiaceae bacterium]
MKKVVSASIGILAMGISAAFADAGTIRVGWTMPGEESKYWMMKREAQFPAIGKDYKIEWSQFQGTAPMAQAMVSGALDCATQGILSLAQATTKGGFEGYIVAQHMGEAKGSFSTYWAVTEDSPIKTVADLKGKKVGINVIGAGNYVYLALALKKAGLDPAKDIQLVETGFAGSEAAVRAGHVDAGIFVQPFAVGAEKKGGLRKVLSGTDVLDSSVLIVEVCRKDFVEKHPDAVKAYIKDITAANKMAADDRAQSVAITAEMTRLPVELLNSYLMTSNDMERPAGAKPDFDAIQKMLDVYYSAGMVSEKLDASKFRIEGFTAPIK